MFHIFFMFLFYSIFVYDDDDDDYFSGNTWLLYDHVTTVSVNMDS